MYAVINKLGDIVTFEAKDLGDPRFSYVEVSPEKVIEFRKLRAEGFVLKYLTEEFIVDKPFRSKSWENIREERKPKLEQADAKIFKLSDEQLIEGVDNTARLAEWAKYRQDLRDVTTQEHPDQVVWPEVPA